MLQKGGRKKIRDAAERRAKELKNRAYQERTILDPSASSTRGLNVSGTSIGKLLRRAADSIGRFDFDVSKFEAKLDEDWYNDASELRNLDVEVLSKYMPRRLAEEVHNQLVLDQLDRTEGIRSSHIASGVYEGDEEERMVSWNLDEHSV